ncbi:K+/H+ antiporter subunit F [Novosphingobium sp. M1R2S20]|uniref:K+/H+ antiporter subunit F n=1 Tax=Novosphingobium rhizovicinum TaxID=3228928 RepID=A0ABV3RF91_9SPHN
MSTLLLTWAFLLAQGLLGIALLCAAYRVVAGPRAQDRVLGLDSLYVTGMLMLLVLGMQSGRTIYFEAAFVIALTGFAGTVALAKFLMRGEVIE